ncbi:hypothetical protein BKA81DRAFT_347984 [Phyllosticta paracitricarpa]
MVGRHSLMSRAKLRGLEKGTPRLSTATWPRRYWRLSCQGRLAQAQVEFSYLPMLMMIESERMVLLALPSHVCLT